MESLAVDDSAGLISTFQELAVELAKMISSARKEIYLAPRYYEPAITSRLLAKLAEGIPFHMLDAKACGLALEERLRSAYTHDTKNRSLIQKALDTQGVIVSVERLDYSFVVVDGELCGVELVNPLNPDDFFGALKIRNRDLGSKLIQVFEGLSGSQNSRNNRSVE